MTKTDKANRPKPRTWISVSDDDYLFMRNATYISDPREALETYLAQCIHEDKKRNAVTVEAIKQSLLDETVKALVRSMGKDETIKDENGKSYCDATARIWVKRLISEKNAYKQLCEAHGLSLTNGASHVAQ